jgi:hypothetical protein
MWWSVQVMKLPIMQSSPTYLHFLPPRCRYSPKHPVVKHPQFMFLPSSLTCLQKPATESHSKPVWSNPRLIS